MSYIVSFQDSRPTILPPRYTNPMKRCRTLSYRLVSLRISPHRSSQRRKYDATKLLMIPTMMNRQPFRHVSGIVRPPQHKVLIIIELLHPAMRRDIVGTGNLEHAPHLPIFDVRLQLPSHKSRRSEAERRHEVIPHRIAEEVCEAEVIPRRTSHVVCERVPQLSPSATVELSAALSRHAAACRSSSCPGDWCLGWRTLYGLCVSMVTVGW